MSDPTRGASYNRHMVNKSRRLSPVTQRAAETAAMDAYSLRGPTVVQPSLADKVREVVREDIVAPFVAKKRK